MKDHKKGNRPKAGPGADGLPAGYRWLREDEILQEGDEYWCVRDWYKTENVGRPANGAAGPYIRKAKARAK